MATRILSFQQLVLEADPDWQRMNLRPLAYVMTDGRRFYSPANPYGQTSYGFIILDVGILDQGLVE